MHNDLILKLNEKKNTHPNLISFWIYLLNQKRKSYLHYHTEISNNLNKLNEVKDLTKEQIILITYLNNFNFDTCLNNNNNNNNNIN